MIASSVYDYTSFSLLFVPINHSSILSMYLYIHSSVKFIKSYQNPFLLYSALQIAFQVIATEYASNL